jgi:hypothetical protein
MALQIVIIQLITTEDVYLDMAYQCLQPSPIP